MKPSAGAATTSALIRVSLGHSGRRSADSCPFWALLEIANGCAHFALAAMAGGYFPGLATAPLLLGLGGLLAWRPWTRLADDIQSIKPKPRA